MGDVLVQHPKTRFISFTGSRDVGLRINELAAKPQPGQIWIKRVVAEMGGKDAIIVDGETDLEKPSMEWSPPPSDSRARSAPPAHAPSSMTKVYDQFLEKL